jgi:hypothetical protein
MKTETREIPSFPDYRASADGRIWSTKRQGRWLKPCTSQGYPRVSLRRDGQTYARPVHVLIAEAFHGPRPNGMQVCHNDGDPSNPSAANLRYDTPSGNMRDMVKHGAGNAGKTHCPQGHPYDETNTRHYRTGRICKACMKAHNDARPRKYARDEIDWSQFRL